MCILKCILKHRIFPKIRATFLSLSEEKQAASAGLKRLRGSCHPLVYSLYRYPIYRDLLHRLSLNHKMNCKVVQPVCTDKTRLLECLHRFRVGRPNIILQATNTHISDQMRSPRMIFSGIWRPGHLPFPALNISLVVGQSSVNISLALPDRDISTSRLTSNQ